MEARTGRPVYEQPPGLFTQHTDKFIVDDDDMDSNSVTESDLSSKNRSFLHRVNDRVRKLLDQSTIDATKDRDKHSVIWGMFMFFFIASICIHGEEIFRQLAFHQKYRSSHHETDVRHI